MSVYWAHGVPDLMHSNSRNGDLSVSVRSPTKANRSGSPGDIGVILTLCTYVYKV